LIENYDFEFFLGVVVEEGGVEVGLCDYPGEFASDVVEFEVDGLAGQVGQFEFLGEFPAMAVVVPGDVVYFKYLGAYTYFQRQNLLV
jgi:hypothetical protein